MSSPVSRHVDHHQRRADVGEAALRVIARDGVTAASVRAIAGEAGMSTSWVTHYFDDHDDVILQAVEQLRLFFEACCAGLCALPPDEALRGMLMASTIGPEQATARRALLHLGAGPIPDGAHREVARLEHWCAGQFEEQIRLAVEMGYRGPDDQRAAVDDLHVLVLGLRMATRADPSGWPTARVEEAIDRALLRTLGTRR